MSFSTMLRAVAVSGAAVLTLGLGAAPSDAATHPGDRAKRSTHLAVAVARNSHNTYTIKARLKRAGRGYAGKVLVLQSKGRHGWHKVRHTAARTDSTGLIVLNGCVRPGNPVVRVHFAGDAKSKSTDSRHFHAHC